MKLIEIANELEKLDVDVRGWYWSGNGGPDVVVEVDGVRRQITGIEVERGDVPGYVPGIEKTIVVKLA